MKKNLILRVVFPFCMLFILNSFNSLVLAADCRVLNGHSDYVRAVAFSTDGNVLASGSDDETIKLWDVQTGNLIRTLTGHTDYVMAVAFSPDGEMLASGADYYDGSVKLWYYQTGELIGTLPYSTNGVYSLAFSPDGKWLALGCANYDVRLWNTQTGGTALLSGHVRSVNAVTFSPDSKRLASGDDHEDIKIWDVQNLTLIKTLSPSSNGGHVDSLGFSPDSYTGNILAAGYGGSTIKIWNVQYSSIIRELSGHSEGVLSVSYSSDGNTLASGSKDNTIKIWDIQTGDLISTLTEHTDDVFSVAFSPTNDLLLASGSRDESVRLCNLSQSNFEVNSVSISLSPSVVQTGYSPTGSGTINGEGTGTVEYHWISRKPGGIYVDSGPLYTEMSNGTASIPDYNNFPTDLPGQYSTFVRVTSPNVIQSSTKGYFVNFPPFLSNASVTPQFGDVGDTFVFEVTYQDQNNDSPATKEIHIQNSITGVELPGSPFQMTHTSGDPQTGETFMFEKSDFTMGNYEYWYYFTDGTGGSAREPGAFGYPFSVQEMPPEITSFSINGGDSTTPVRFVTLNNQCTNNPTHYMASEDPNFNDTSWQNYISSASPTFQLSEENGVKTVYFKVKNNADVSLTVSDTIELIERIPTMFLVVSYFDKKVTRGTPILLQAALKEADPSFTFIENEFIHFEYYKDGQWNPINNDDITTNDLMTDENGIGSVYFLVPENMPIGIYQIKAVYGGNTAYYEPCNEIIGQLTVGISSEIIMDENYTINDDTVGWILVNTFGHQITGIPPTGSSERIPLILVHGNNSERDGNGILPDTLRDDARWGTFWDYINNSDQYSQFDVYTWIHDTSKAIGFNGNTGNASELADCIYNYILPHYQPGTKIIFVAHSRGGLVVRSFMNYNNQGDDVQGLITLGTPHHGSPFAVPDWIAIFWAMKIGTTGEERTLFNCLINKERSTLCLLSPKFDTDRLGDLNLAWDNLDNAIMGVVQSNFDVWFSAYENVYLTIRDTNRVTNYSDQTVLYSDNYKNCFGTLYDLNQNFQFYNKIVSFGAYDDDLSNNDKIDGVYDPELIQMIWADDHRRLGAIVYWLAQFSYGDIVSNNSVYYANDGLVPLQSALLLDISNGDAFSTLNGDIVTHNANNIRARKGNLKRYYILYGNTTEDDAGNTYTLGENMRDHLDLIDTSATLNTQYWSLITNEIKDFVAPNPQTPTPVSPADESTIQTLTPTFEWSAFQDGGDGESQAGYQLRVRCDNEASWEFESQTDWGTVPTGWLPDSYPASAQTFRQVTYDSRECLHIKAPANTWDRVKVRTQETFGAGRYEWKVYIPPINEPGASSSIGAFLNSPLSLGGDNVREIDFEIGYGKEEQRTTYGIPDGKLMCYMVLQKDARTGTEKSVDAIPIDPGNWYSLVLEMFTNAQNNYVISWKIKKEGEAQFQVGRSNISCGYGPDDTSFYIECSVENFDNNWIGDKEGEPTLDKDAYFDYVLFGDTVVYDTGFIEDNSAHSHLYSPGLYSGVDPVSGDTKISESLEWGKHYHWHVRYQDSGGDWSEWSADDENFHQDFYTQQQIAEGQLKVNIQPQGAIDAGAQWKITTESIWQNSGATINLAPGSYVIEFKTINGWSKSDNTGITVSQGQLTEITSDYTQLTPGTLQITPQNNLNASGEEGGPFTPDSIVYDITNTGETEIAFTVTKSVNWITLSNTGQTLNPGQSTIVSVFINSDADNLSQGNYSDDIIFTNTTNGNGNTTRQVSLTITETQSPEIKISQGTMDIPDNGSLDFGSIQIGSSPNITLTIENIGTADLNLSGSPVITITGTNSEQFSVVQQPGLNTITPGNSTTFILSFSPTSLDSKTASISIANNDADENPYDITLSGTGIEGPILNVAPTSWDAPPEGGTSPTIDVTNSGGGNPFTYTVSEDAEWIEISSNSGTTPGSFTITATENLTGITRSADVIVSAAGVSGSPQSINVTQLPTTSPYIIISNHEYEEYRPHLAKGNNSILVVWQDKRLDEHNKYAIYGARLNYNGDVLDSDGIFLKSSSSASFYHPRAAFNGEKYLVVWSVSILPYEIQGRFIYENGNVGDVLSLGSGADDQELEFGTSNFFLMWEKEIGDEDHLFGKILDGDANTISSQITIVNSGDVRHSQLVYFDGKFFVFWMVKDSNNQYSLYFKRIAENGTVLDSSGIKLLGPTANYIYLCNPVSAGGHVFAFVNEANASGYMFKIDGDGNVTSETKSVGNEDVFYFDQNNNWIVNLTKDSTNKRLLANRLDLNGNLLDATPIHVLTYTESVFRAYKGTTLGNDNNFVVFNEYFNSQSDVYGVIFQLPPFNPVLSVSQSTWESNAGGETSPEITVTNSGNGGSINYTVSESADWLDVSSTAGNTPGSFTISTTPNNTGTTRNADVTVTAVAAAGSPKTITISQPSLCISPSITNQPQDQTINAGETAMLIVIASGTEPFHYQWYQGNSWDTTTPVGDDSSSFTTPVLTETTNYWVKVSNNCGTVDSNAATIMVNPPAIPEINISHETVEIPNGGIIDFGALTEVILTIENTGTANLILSLPIVIAGENADQFSIVQQPVSPIASGGTTTLTVRFTPTTVGTKTASLSIGNNDPDENPYDITMIGTGVEQGTLIVEPTTWVAPAGGGTSPTVNVSVEGAVGPVTYTVSEEADWLGISDTGGSTPGTFTISALPNTPGENREAFVTVMANVANGSPQMVKVIQHRISLAINSGTINNTPLDVTLPEITVEKGQLLQGTVNLSASNYYPCSSCIMPFAWTPTWGNHQGSFQQISGHIPWRQTVEYDVNIDLDVPVETGTYYLWFVMAARYNSAEMMSCDRPQVWDDGDDFADMGETQYQEAVSIGGVNWTFNDQPHFHEAVRTIKVIVTDPQTYRLWYDGKPGHSGLSGGGFGYATSADGINLTRHPGNPILTNGTSGTFNEFESSSPYIVYDGSLYHMLFIGRRDEGDTRVYKIGYATSSDGVQWDFYGQNPVQLDNGNIDSLGPIIYINGYFKMWYSKNGDTYYATTLHPGDSILDMVKFSENPVLTRDAAGGWDKVNASASSVIYECGIYKMWYSGKTYDPYIYKIGYATSCDGLTWTKHLGNPVFDDTTVTCEMAPAVVQDSEGYKMYYTAATGGSDYYPVRLATSSDGVNWTKYSDTPVLPGGSDYWEAMRLGVKTVMWGDPQLIIGTFISHISPLPVNCGIEVAIIGAGFGDNPGNVSFVGESMSIQSWSDTEILVTAPSSANSGLLFVETSTGTLSNNCTLTVECICTPPLITLQPQSITIDFNTSTSLSVEVEGSVPLHYQWYQGESGDTSTPVGEDSPTFTTPALTVTTNYWVQVSNDCGSVDSNVASITVNLPPGIVVTSPNGGETWEAGSGQTVTWSSTGTISNVIIEYSTNGGTSWTTIAPSTANTGGFNWIVPDNPSENCLVRISGGDIDGGPSDVSDAVFSIVSESPASIRVISPNSGERLAVGSTHEITWASNGAIGDVKIEYSIDNGTSWINIVSSMDNNGSYNWTVPDTPSDSCLVRIGESDKDIGISDVSDGGFSIVSAPFITIKSPNGGEIWEVGSTHQLTWTSSGIDSNVKIEYSINNGTSWTPIAASTDNTGGISWTVPDSPAENCLIKISDIDGEPSDVSDVVFSIVPPSSLTVTSPNGGENWNAGSTQGITWSSSGAVGKLKIEYSIDNGASWSTIVTSADNKGSHTWIVPDNPSENCLVRISESDVDGGLSDISDDSFSIVPAPVVIVTSPNGGERLEANSTHDITWTSNGTVEEIKIEYSTDNGSSWAAIVTSTANDSNHSWTVPDNPSNNCLVRISETDGEPADISDAVFSIASPSSSTITITSPNGGESLTIDTTHEITWTCTGMEENDKVMIEYSPDIGGSWLNIVSAAANTGSYNWTVPDNPSENCLIRIVGSDSDEGPSDVSDEPFAIIPPSSPTITVTSPNGGETLTSDSIHDITWTCSGMETVENVVIEYSTDNGVSWTAIVFSTSDMGTLSWTVPDQPSENCLIRIRLSDIDEGPSDTSDEVFSIISAPLITVTSPNGGEQWKMGSIYNITWSSTGITGNIIIDLYRGTSFDLNIGSASVEAGSFAWNIPANFTIGNDYKIFLHKDSTEDYSDGEFSIVDKEPNQPDFNNDGHVDILWRNYATGNNEVWLMNGSIRTETSSLPAMPDLNWRLVGTGDFNRDGKVDILWRNYTTGQNLVWYMDGIVQSGFEYLLNQPDINMQIAGTGDFNEDGNVDILWRNPLEGRNQVWYMEGVTVKGYQGLQSLEGIQWRVAGTGDFNGDNLVDILWRNYTTGSNEVWYMNGASHIGTAAVLEMSDLDWRIVGTGDFNRDGERDILWRNYSDGENMIWTMDGVTRTGYEYIETRSDLNWQVVGNGDYKN